MAAGEDGADTQALDRAALIPRRRAAAAPNLRPVETTPPLDLATLSAWLDDQGMALDREPAPRLFAGGAANLNYLLSIDGAFCVLRRAPSGDLPPGAHDMAREHALLSRLAPVLAEAPRSLALCEDRSVLGAPFQILEYRAGLVVHGVDRSKVGEDAETGDRLCTVMVETLARLHAVDLETAQLTDFGRPEGFLGRTLEGWLRRARRALGEDAPASLIALENALSDPPPDAAPTLIHNDFKLDNMILEPETLSVSAVVDWDMGTLGHPLFDVAVCLSYWPEPGDPELIRMLGQMPTETAGFWSRRSFVDRYAALTGADVSQIEYFRALAVFKLAVVVLQLHVLAARGDRSNPKAAFYQPLGLALLDFALTIARER
ncbi:MAG: phosphotransferase family protein [Maricaulaceae bacterium]